MVRAVEPPGGAPSTKAIDKAPGGSLAAATNFYKFTAIDGAGGETTASNEVSQVTVLNNKNTLTWNVVPNATGYNVYRSTTTNTEIIMVSAALPIAQVPAGTLTVTFVDDGTAVTNLVIAVTGGVVNSVTSVGALKTYKATFTVSS